MPPNRGPGPPDRRHEREMAAGVDGCRGGWGVAAGRRDGRGPANREVVATIAGGIERVLGRTPDDVLDARAVLWTARRLARGQAERLGDGAHDERGLRMEIVV